MNNRESVEAVERVLQEDIDRQIAKEKLAEKKKLQLTSKYDKKIIIIFGIGLLLLTLGITLSFILKDKNSVKEDNNINKEEVVDIKINKKTFNEVSTEDNVFKITKCDVEYNEKTLSSNILFNYISTINYDELALIVIYENDKSNYKLPVLLHNVESNKNIVYSINSYEDLTKYDNIKIEITTKDVLIKDYNYVV